MYTKVLCIFSKSLTIQYTNDKEINKFFILTRRLVRICCKHNNLFSRYRYDIIIVGSGLYGAILVYRAKQNGLRCLVLERRKKVGGNVRDEWIDGINVHQYGAHIFHTEDEQIWNFISQFSDFIPYFHTVMAQYKEKLYHLPFSMYTFYDIYGITKPYELEQILVEEHQKEWYEHPDSLEEMAINIVGRTIYEILIKGYTEKQWGVSARELSADLINRLPIRSTFDNRYFNDRYQGIPSNGYSKIIKKLLKGIEVKTNTDFCLTRNYWIQQSKKIVYTGMIDELFGYSDGTLGYRSLDFASSELDTPNFQGLAVINETDYNVPFTRIIEHKHFMPLSNIPQTIITKEYPKVWKPGEEAYYPIDTRENNAKYKKYIEKAKEQYPTIFFGGRLGCYKYYDMDDAIRAALNYKFL